MKILEHPFAPEACWKFAISRPFQVPRVDELLTDLRRTLGEHGGLVLECFNAPNDPESEAFWMNRMKIILELADFHIFFQFGETAQVEFELNYSKNVTRRGDAPALDTNFKLKRRRAHCFIPTIIFVYPRHGRDRFSGLLNKGVIYCPDSCTVEDFRNRFVHLVDLGIHARVRTIGRWYRMDERSKRFTQERLKPILLDVMMKLLLNRAQRDPKLLNEVGGPDNARKFLDLQMSARRLARRPPLEVRNTLIRDSELARVIAREPGALDLNEQWKLTDPRAVASENKTEAYLLTIRRGDADYRDTFSKTYGDEKDKYHSKVDKALYRLRETAGPKKIPPESAAGAVEELRGLLDRFEGIASLLGVWKLRRRVRQAKGKFYKDPKD